MKNTENTSSKAITTPDYWEKNWASNSIPKAIDPTNNSPENYYYQVMHKRFVNQLGSHCSNGEKLIEIGCGGSVWLPYFHNEFGYEVSGIDYTEAGVKLSKNILDQEGVAANILFGDLFEPPPDWIESFDVVVSFGLVEHFEKTSDIILACSRYLRPGGKMITLVPTMRGLYGLAYKLIRSEVYNKHIPQTRISLAQAHRDVGLDVLESDYILGLPGLLKKPISDSLLAKIAYKGSLLYWKLEKFGIGVPPNIITSPYALCISRKRID